MPAQSVPDFSVLRRKAQTHWTAERLQRLLAGKKLPLHPVTHCAFLHTTGLMEEDASVTSGQVRKFLQINHMISLIAPPFRALAKAMPGRTLTLLDAGCGNSYLSLSLSLFWRGRRRRGARRKSGNGRIQRSGCR